MSVAEFDVLFLHLPGRNGHENLDHDSPGPYQKTDL
jgi:hypothetical protein